MFRAGKDDAIGAGGKVTAPVTMSGKQQMIEASSTPQGAQLTIDKAPIVGKVRQALETAQFKAAQGDKKGKRVGPGEVAALQEVLNDITRLGTQKGLKPAELKAQTHSIADKLTHISLMMGQPSLNDAGQTLAHGKKQMKPVVLEAWKCEPIYDFGEYERQIKDQQDGANSMLASRWPVERAKYAAAGRGRESKNAQNRFRKQTGIVGDKTKAAPHNPDGVAAGHPDPTGKPADSGVNSSIGAQWPAEGRAGRVDKEVEKIPDDEKATTQLNLQMSVVKAPVKA